MSCCTASKACEQIAAHVEVDLAGEQQRPAGDLRAALLDGDLEAAGGIGAVGDGLVVAAMLGLGEPVGAEGHRDREGAGRHGRGDGESRRGNLEKPVHDVTLCLPSRNTRAEFDTLVFQARHMPPGEPFEAAENRCAPCRSAGMVPIFQARVHVARRTMLPLDARCAAALRCRQREIRNVQVPDAEIDKAALRKIQPRRRGAGRASGWSSAPANSASDRTIRSPRTPAAQAELCFSNVSAVLAEAGLGLKDACASTRT